MRGANPAFAQNSALGLFFLSRCTNCISCAMHCWRVACMSAYKVVMVCQVHATLAVVCLIDLLGDLLLNGLLLETLLTLNWPVYPQNSCLGD